MKTRIKTLAIAATALSLLAGSAMAQPYGGYNDSRGSYRESHRSYDNGRGNDYGRYDNRRGYDNDRNWSRGQRLPQSYRSNRYAIDYRRHHLRAPPRGYQWRHVDNDYILAAVATGLIAEIISGR